MMLASAHHIFNPTTRNPRCRSCSVAPGETEMADLKLRNEDDFGMVADLITLPHLHEPALLHSLSRRFAEGAIYTFTGPDDSCRRTVAVSPPTPCV